MDITSPFKSEVLRPFTTWVIPGSIAVAPYILVLGFYLPQVTAFWNTHPSAAVGVIVICALAAGLILENIGASIESGWWDTILQGKDESHLRNWDRYLKLRIKDEFVAQRYLKTRVMQLKFELSMAPALLLFWIGLLWLNYLYQMWQQPGVIFVSALLFLGILYLLRESYVSSRVLSGLRELILAAVEEESTKREKESAERVAQEGVTY